MKAPKALSKQEAQSGDEWRREAETDADGWGGVADASCVGVAEVS